MPPLQQTQKEKHQGRRTNPYRRPRLATLEFFGSQFEWTQAQQLHSNTVENEWQNMTSNEFGDNTNDYDDNEKPSIKQVSEPKEMVLMVASLENSSRRSDINTKRGVTVGVEQNDSMVQPLEQREPVPVLAHKWPNIINNNNQSSNNVANNNSQFNNSIIASNNRQFGGFVAQNSGQINNNIIINNGNSIITNSNGRNNVITSNINRNGIINSNIGRSSIITNNSRSIITSNGVITNSRNSTITNNIGRNSGINNNISRNSGITNNIGRNSVTTNNNGRSNVITNNNGRNGVTIANNIGRSNVINNNVRNNIITNSQFSNYVSHNSNQASKSFVTHNNGQVGNGFVAHNNSQACNSFVTHNNGQVSSSFVTHNNSQFKSNQFNSSQFSSSQFSSSQFSSSQFSSSQFSSSQFSSSQFSSSQFSNNQFNNSQFSNSQLNNSQSNKSIAPNNSSIVNTSNNGSKVSNSQVNKSIVANDSNQVSNSINSKVNNNIVNSNSVQASNGDNSKVSNSTVTSNINQVNNITVTENNNKVENDNIASNKSSEVSNSTFINNSSKMSNNNSNEIDSTEQPEGSTVIPDVKSPGVSRRSRKRKSGKGRRVRRGKGRSDVRNQDQSQTIIANTEEIKEHPVEEADNINKRRASTEDIKEHPVEEVGNVNKRRKIVSENDDESLAMDVDGNEEVVSMEDPNIDNVNAMTTTIMEPPSNTEPPSSVKTPTRAKSRSSRSKKRRNDRKNSAARKPRGKRGRPNVEPSGTNQTEDARSSDQDEQLESMPDVPQSLVAPVPDVPEPEPKQTIALRKYLETLYLDEQILSRDRLLRLGMYILDYFVSQAWCRPFVNPEDESAVIYRQIITRLMDLTTVEHNLWAGEYNGAVSKFYNDLAQIIYNAFKFHPEGSIIFNEANLMLTCFVDLTTKFSKPPHDLNKLDAMLAQASAKLPHEEFGDVCSVSPNIESRIYIVPLYSFRQVSRSGSNVAKLPQAAAERLDPMSRPLFDIFERRNLPSVRFQPTETHCNFARLYITMGAQNIKNCRDERNAILVIVKDVSYARGENRLRCNAIISKPFGELRELDTIGFPELQDARYWTRVAFLDKVTLDLKVGPKFFDKYLRTPFKVSEYDKEKITLQQHDAFLAALNLRQSSLSDGLSIWQRLVAEANRVKVPVESLESLGKPIQVDAEGFFKRVFHVPGDDKYVVQNFKEISEGTLETRIKEAVCCLKTKGVSNTGQIRSVYKDDEYDELVGLSMERYNYTLKEYAFNTRSPITGEQKYRLIHDMVKGIKALHDAGFAHRDLSEVNMMVNNTTEKLADGSTKPELVVIDFGKAEFINRDDVLAWSVGEVTNDKLEHLPWIKTVPDHGYKLYRSAATLPRTKNDHAVLQYPIDPCSEDVYAAGVLAWRIFSGQAPWGGILDTDLKNLREIVTDPIKIKFHIEKNVNGKMSRELLLKCITATSQERSTAKELLDWLLQSKDELISEWATSGRMRIRKQL